MEGPAGSFAEPDLPGVQGRIALAVLVHERAPVPRSRLADLIWCGEPPDGWSPALNAVISKVRGLLSAIGCDPKRVLVSSSGCYELALPPQAWVDLEDGMRRLDRAEAALRRREVDLAWAEASVASSIHRRPFLAGVDTPWTGQVRAVLDDRLHRSYAVLAEAWLARGEHDLAASVASAAVDLDPLREPAHRLLIRARLGAGDRAGALRAYDRCRVLLRDQLGVEPSSATQVLYTEALG